MSTIIVTIIILMLFTNLLFSFLSKKTVGEDTFKGEENDEKSYQDVLFEEDYDQFSDKKTQEKCIFVEKVEIKKASNVDMTRKMGSEEDKIVDIEKEKKIDIDLREAIIYSEIINNPFIERYK